jgi:membrane-associated phospholipid phosphatase
MGKMPIVAMLDANDVGRHTGAAGATVPRMALSRSRDHGLRTRGAIPVLEAKRHSLSERLGERLHEHHPVTVFIGLAVLCYALLAATTIAVGLFFTEIVLTPGLDNADEGVVEWIVEHRTPERNDLSFFGSEVSGGIVIPALVALVALGFAIRRRWRLAGFLIAAIVLEAATYRATVFFVDRERPDVPRLEQLPVDASFPSGHIAASIAVYCGLALLLTSRVTSPHVRIVAWTLALAVPVVVGISRLYRGMHHPLDLAAGILIGVAALVLAVFVARVTGVVVQRRATERESAQAIHEGRPP